MKKSIKITLSIYTTLALITSCTPNTINNTQIENYSRVDTNKVINKYTVRGKVEFPTHTPRVLPSGRPGSKGVGYNTKATLGQVGNKATISIIYPPDYSTVSLRNVSVGTGLTDASGVFIVNPSETFTPTTGDIYILEALKRIGAAGIGVITIRTYIKWNGSSWESMTTPDIYINSKTTALSIIDSYDSSISASQTIGSIIIDTPDPGSNPTAIGSVTTTTILGVSDFVDNLLTQDIDPVRNISFLNNKYFVNREVNHAKNTLNAGLDCPNCDLTNEDLNGNDYSSRDLSNANFTGANLTGTTLTNADFTGANLSDTTLTNATFTGAKWTNGKTCGTNSVGFCNLEFKVNTTTSSSQVDPSVSASSSGNFVVTWEGQGTGDLNGIFAQRYTSTGAVAGSEFRVNTFTTNNQLNPAVAMDNSGNFVIVWQSSGQDAVGNYGIYGQRYLSNGTTNGTEFRINTYTTNTQTNPSIAIDSDGDFVISWQSQNQEVSTGNYFGIYAQRYNSNGATNGGEFRVNTYTTNTQSNPSVAIDSDGDFVISWSSLSQTGDTSYGIYAQKYNSSGGPVNSEIHVNSTTASIQKFPSVAMDDDGDFVISWVSNNQDASTTYGIYAQRYNTSGAVAGGEFLVNTFTTSNQSNPSAVMDNTGNFVIAWESNNQDGSQYGVFAQRYSNLGATQGNEFRVNTFTSDVQKASSVAMDSNGNFIVIWQSNNQDGNLNGIYGQMYTSLGVTQ